MMHGKIAVPAYGDAARLAAEAIASEDREVIDYISSGRRCRGCGECCSRFLPLLPGEAATIARWALGHGISPHSPRGGAHAVDLMCPWLSDSCECTIYDARPLVCRLFSCDKRPGGFTPEDVLQMHRASGGIVLSLHDMRDGIYMEAMHGTDCRG